MASAVFSDNPEAALELLEGGDRESNMFGQRNTYEEWYDKMLELEMKTCDVDKYKNVSFII